MIINPQIRRKLRDLALKTKIVDGVELPGSVVFLKKLLNKVVDPLDREDIYLAIVVEYKKAGLFAQEINILREYASEFKNEFMPMVTLADRLRYEYECIEEAKEIIKVALEKAKEKSEFVRLVLGVRARIAREIKDQELYFETLSELTADYKSNHREIEIQFEDDFTKELPNNFCLNKIIEDYLACKPIS